MLLGKGAKDAGPSTRSALLPLMAESYLTYFATTRYPTASLLALRPFSLSAAVVVGRGYDDGGGDSSSCGVRLLLAVVECRSMHARM